MLKCNLKMSREEETFKILIPGFSLQSQSIHANTHGEWNSQRQDLDQEKNVPGCWLFEGTQETE